MTNLCCNPLVRSIQEEDGMSVESHVQELRRKHQSLSSAIEAAHRSPGTDDLTIAQMKKEKLRLKEEITRLSH
ncbi:protein of unknown function DUF465 [Paracoccus denitrificans PD1222]|uniref:DUF465 domain-containing protein n=2 Tax=Paracoccaceae TaxID=31989 RepID=A1B3M6_PARDP|nr:protein of unknown function DUF465 [Paracoccus denitrificans PD1222]